MAGAFVLVGGRNYIQWVDDTVHRSGVTTLFAGFQHIVLVCICLSGSCKKSADMICERGNVAKSVIAQSNVRPCENGSAHGWRCCGNCLFGCMVICCVPRAREQKECVSAVEEEIGRTKDRLWAWLL